MFERTSAPVGGNCALPLLEADEADPEPLGAADPGTVVELDVDPDEVVEDDPPVVVEPVPDEPDDDPGEVGVKVVAELLDAADDENWVVVVPTDDLVIAVEPPHPVI